MKKMTGVFVLLSFILAACGDLGIVTSAPDPFSITPSRQPIIITATPIIVLPSTSATLPFPPSLTNSLDQHPSPSATFTLTFPPPSTETFTVTNAPLPPTITLLGCDTGFDVSHGMGEVTNAYITVANRFGPDLSNMCATLASADEGRVHPDKTVCVPSLPMGFQVTLKLTIDTTYQVNTIVQVSLTSNEEITTVAGGLACKDIGTFKPADDTLQVVAPIP
jgi:hypothetical protein